MIIKFKLKKYGKRLSMIIQTNKQDVGGGG